VRQQLYRLLAEIHLTTIMVTHNYLEALLFGHSILVLDHGQIIQQGDQHTLLQQPRSSYVAELVGTNFFRGHIARRGTSALCTIQLPGQQEPPLEIQAVMEEQVAQKLAVDEEAFVVVDPRSITLHTTDPAPHSSARNCFRGNIIHILQVGATLGDSASTDDGRVRVSILLDASTYQLTAEITSTSVVQMELSEGQAIYATFKATEARAYT
jgi:molybdopterin-binding protein